MHEQEQDMEPKPVSRFRWFWPWQDDAEEAWLEEMSGEGLHLSSAGSFGRYRFVTGKPVRFAYRLDYRRTARKEKGEYLQLFRDSGWEYAGESRGWHYFRKPMAPGDSHEILTDRESKIDKYRRLSAFYAFFVIFSLMFLTRTLISGRGAPGNDLLISAWAILLVCFAVITFMLRRRIRALKSGI
jgi:hypothetical protein